MTETIPKMPLQPEKWREILQRFVEQPGGLHPSIQHPYTRDGRTMATDGRVLIELDFELEGVPIAVTQPSHAGIFAAFEDAEWGPLPEGTWPLERCECENACCKECKGTGAILYFGSQDHYTLTCPRCDGVEPFTEDCPDCNGRGYYVPGKPIAIVGGVMLNAYCINIIADLPAVEIAQNQDQYKPVYFRFGCGRGALMPVDPVTIIEDSKG